MHYRYSPRKERIERRIEAGLDVLMACALGVGFAVLLVWQLSK